MLMLVPAGSPIFFLREHRFVLASKQRLHKDFVYAFIIVDEMFVLHIIKPICILH